jgi:hypothetical protein
MLARAKREYHRAYERRDPRMLLILAGLVGLFTGLFIHWLTWTLRLRYPSVTLILGALGALGLTGFCLLFLNSDIRNMMLIVLGILWGVALLLGALQAPAWNAPWWKGVLGMFFEMALAFFVGAAVNLGLQSLIKWFNQNFPGVDVYAVINAILSTMIITLLLLAVLRPLLRSDRSP